MAWTFAQEPANPFPSKCPSCEMWQMSWWEDTRTSLVYGHCTGCHIMLLSVRKPGIYVMSPTAVERALKSVEQREPTEKEKVENRFALWDTELFHVLIMAASGYVPSEGEEKIDERVQSENTDPRRDTRDQGEGETG